MNECSAAGRLQPGGEPIRIAGGRSCRAEFGELATVADVYRVCPRPGNGEP